MVLGVVSSTLLASFLQKPLYEGEVKLILETAESEVLFDLGNEDGADMDRVIATEMEVVKSAPVREAVVENVGPVAEPVIEQIGESDIIAIRGYSRSRATAAAAAEAYARAYIDFRRRQAVNDLREAGRKVREKVEDLQEQLVSLEGEIARTASQGLSTTGLIARRDSLVTQHALFQQRLDELQVQTEFQGAGARLVNQTSVPTRKVQPAPLRNGVFALAVGLVLGVSLALLLEYFDDTVRTKDDFARAVNPLPILSTIPLFEERFESTAISLIAPRSAATEAYRALRTSLQFLGGVERPPKIFQLTSASAGEGKTTTVANLGVVLARAGLRVLMVDLDLRRAQLHAFFGVSPAVGFTTVFLKQTTLTDAQQKVAGCENLWLLASGSLPPNPSELLASKRTAEILVLLEEAYDVVLIDCPPALPVADATIVSTWVDATLLVARAGTTRSKDLQRAIELLRQSNVPVSGTVLNGVAGRESYGYSYGYEKTPREEEVMQARPSSSEYDSESTSAEGGTSPQEPLNTSVDTGTNGSPVARRSVRRTGHPMGDG